MGAASTISWFRDIGRADRPTVGGKGASLGELSRAGLRVPDGFVVTTAAFEEFLRAVDPGASIRAAIEALDPDDLGAAAKATADIRARLLGAELPDPVRGAIEQAYLTLGASEKDLAVAVRSSATSEDSEEASFAGLQDTQLWVKGARQVIAGTRACWASLYGDASVLYRRRLGLPENQVAMGVVVQRMVDARCAGVMFTRSPTTGDRSVIAINASWGLGSSVVGGEVTPDEFIVGKVTGELIEHTISDKTIRHVPCPAGGVRAEAVPEAERRAPCLDQREIAALVELAKRAEHHYGMAQDIEWAIGREGGLSDTVFVLQSRPETVWSNRRRGPIEKPKANPFEHVLGALSGAAGARKG